MSKQTEERPPSPVTPSVTPLEPEWNRMTFGYRLSLFLVAMVVILLPLCYFAIVGGAIAAIVQMIRHHELWLRSLGDLVARWFQETPGKAIPPDQSLMRFLSHGYLLTILLLIGFVFFMIKHILHAQQPGEGALILRRERQPRLWDLVEEISRLTGAPMPETIMVSRDVNAYACSILPWWNPFGQERLILTIGLPLIAILSKRELAGIIAHELGHFSQHTASWLHGLIHRILDWFYRVVNWKDKWDEQVVNASISEDWRSNLFAGLLGSMVFLSRCLLLFLYKIGEAASCFMLRRMELDADRFEIRLVGSAAFEDVTRKFQVMGEAQARTMVEFFTGLKQEKALPDDLPGLCVRKYEEIPQDVRMSIWQKCLSNELNLLDTHPTEHCRVEQAWSMKEPGIFKDVSPARELLSDLQDIGIAATHSYYDWSGLLRIPKVKVRFLDIPPDPFSDDTTLFAAVERVFHGNFLTQFNQPLPEVNLDRRFDPELIFKDMVRFQKARRERGKMFGELEECQTKWLDELGNLQEEYLLNPSGRPVLLTRIRELNQQLEQVAEALRPLEAETKSRILATLSLLMFWDVSLRLARSGFNSERFRDNFDTLYCLAEYAPTIREVLARTRLLVKESERTDFRSGPDPGSDLTRLLFSAQHDAMKELHDSFKGLECFSPKEKEMVDLGNHLIGKLSDKDNLAGLLLTSQTMDQRFLQMYCRVLGEIALFIEQAERLAGVASDSILPISPKEGESP